MVPLPNNSVRPLTKSSQKPSSWARFSTKFIVLGLLGLGSLTSTVKDPSNQDPTIIIIIIILRFLVIWIIVEKIRFEKVCLKQKE